MLFENDIVVVKILNFFDGTKISFFDSNDARLSFNFFSYGSTVI